MKTNASNKQTNETHNKNALKKSLNFNSRKINMNLLKVNRQETKKYNNKKVFIAKNLSDLTLATSRRRSCKTKTDNMKRKK